jgi:hypothetical protein
MTIIFAADKGLLIVIGCLPPPQKRTQVTSNEENNKIAEFLLIG